MIRLYVQKKREETLKKKGLEGKIMGFSSLLIGTIGLGMISFNITGNSISNLTQNNTKVIGTIFLALGIISAFFYFKNKEKTLKKVNS